MAKYALCIGINNYPGTQNDLAGCVNDADDWNAELARRGFSVQRLIDRQATGKAMRAGIRNVLAGAQAGDLVVVQYSGHGSFVPDENGDEPDGADECLCPYDVRSRGPITDDELFDLYSARPEGVKLLMISDSCNSGTVSKFAPITMPPSPRGSPDPRARVRFRPPRSTLNPTRPGSESAGESAPRVRPGGMPACCWRAVRKRNTRMMRISAGVQTARSLLSRCRLSPSFPVRRRMRNGTKPSERSCLRNSIRRRRTFTEPKA
jgi:hypothetical protein